VAVVTGQRKPRASNGTWPAKAGEPVTVGDHTTVDGTECSYLLRVFFRPGSWRGRATRRPGGADALANRRAWATGVPLVGGGGQ